MANILLLASRLPYPFHYGDTLRIFHLSRQLSSAHNCFLAVAQPDNGQLPSLLATGVFKEVFFLPAKTGRRSWRRHLRLSEGCFERLSNPEYFHKVVNCLEQLVAERQIDIGIACNRDISVFLKPLEGLKKVVDACDCKTLGQRRFWASNPVSPVSVVGMKASIYTQRVLGHERRLAMDFDLVTTVSPMDQAELKTISRGNPDRIALLPNGVAPELLLNGHKKSEEVRGIVFWGNMDFPPNFTAVRQFYHNVYRPFLREKGVDWTIVGANPPADIEEIGRMEPNIHVTGFVQDLFGLAARIPIMVNPMIIGSGLKNKVLEAFALKRLVVSNAVGIEGVAGAEPGKHYLLAETPEEFARLILEYLPRRQARQAIGTRARQFIQDRYTWESIGRRYLNMIDTLVDHRLAAAN